jgi:hypothetical protein
VATILRDPRVCVILDGWSEFASANDMAERSNAMRLLYGARVIANSRRGINIDPWFRAWEIDPLPVSAVRDAIATALPGRPSPPAKIEELLRLPLALSLYILLGGLAATTGELLSNFHDHLAKTLPDKFKRVLAGAVASVELTRSARSRARFDSELQSQAARSGLANPKGLLCQLGTIEDGGTRVVPVHDLYWSWLSGVGLLTADQVAASLPILQTREGIRLALESGLRPDAAVVTSVQESDALLAGQLSAHLETGHSVRKNFHDKLVRMLEDPRLPVRCRGMLAVLQARNGSLLERALAVLTETRRAKIYCSAVGEVLDLDFLYENRGTLAKWIGAIGTDQILYEIGSGGAPKWSSWLEQMVNAGKLQPQEAVPIALAVQSSIPSWAISHLPTIVKTEAYRLRPISPRKASLELARSVADHYGEIELKTNGWFQLNKILVESGDDRIFADLLEKFDSLPEQAQELLAYVFVERGEPWLPRLQKKAFSAGPKEHLHTLLEKVSLGIDDATARKWIKNGPKLLGWRVLIARHENEILPELLAELPTSYDDLHEMPALKAMEFLKDPPDSLADELWKRVGRTLTPMAGQDLLLALAPIRQRGIPSIVAMFSRNPQFLVGYHLTLFLTLLKKWQEKLGLSFQVRIQDRTVSFIEWLLLQQLPARKAEWAKESRELKSVRELALPVFLNLFEKGDASVADIIVALGPLEKFHAELVQFLLDDSGRIGQIPKLFERSLDTFPEEILLRVLAAPSCEFTEFTRALAVTSNPIHQNLHVAVGKRALESDFDPFLYRTIAQILRAHPRSILQKLMKEIAPNGADKDLWLIREVEAASGELLINENGNWLD